MKTHTLRDKIALRLWIYKRAYKKTPQSYNASLGIGRVPMSQNKPFTGWSINNKRYINGLEKGGNSESLRPVSF